MREYFYNIEGKYAESGRPFVRYRDKYHSLAAAKAAASKALYAAADVIELSAKAGICDEDAGLVSLVEKASRFSKWRRTREW